MDTGKIYHDSEGKECSIWQAVRREPDWAASRIQEGEKAIEKLAELEKSSRSPVGSTDEFDYRQWCDDKTEEIMDKFDAAGTPVRGGACILYALEEAYKLGKNSR